MGLAQKGLLAVPQTEAQLQTHMCFVGWIQPVEQLDPAYRAVSYIHCCHLSVLPLPLPLSPRLRHGHNFQLGGSYVGTGELCHCRFSPSPCPLPASWSQRSQTATTRAWGTGRSSCGVGEAPSSVALENTSTDALWQPPGLLRVELVPVNTKRRRIWEQGSVLACGTSRRGSRD